MNKLQCKVEKFRKLMKIKENFGFFKNGLEFFENFFDFLKFQIS